MAKKKTEEKPLSLKEAAFQHDVKEIKNKLSRLGKPTYSFEIGDKVVCGLLKDCIIDEILEDGKIYGFKYTATTGTPGSYNYKETEAYRYCAWVEVRPLETSTESFVENFLTKKIHIVKIQCVF